MERAQTNSSVKIIRRRESSNEQLVLAIVEGKYTFTREVLYTAKTDGNRETKERKKERKKPCRVLTINGRFAVSVLSLAFGQTQPKSTLTVGAIFRLPNRLDGQGI